MSSGPRSQLDDSFNQNGLQTKSLLATDAPNDAETRKKFIKVLYMGVAFLMLFTAFMSASNLVAQIYGNLGFNQLGKISSFVLYAVFFFALFFTPSIIENWSYKFGVFVGSLGYFFTLISGLMTTSCSKWNGWWCDAGCVYPVNLVSAAINGFTAPILWVSANKYVTGCATEATRGTYLGIFASFVSAAQLIGGVLSAFVTKYFGAFDFYLVATAFVIAAILLFFFAPPVARYGESEEIEKVSVKVKKVIDFMLQKRIRTFLPYNFYVGILLAVYSSFEYEIIQHSRPDDSEDEQTSLTAFVTIPQAAAGIIASYTAGRLADLFRLKMVLSFYNVFSLVGIVFGFIAYASSSLPLCYVMGIFLGAGYSGALALTNITMAKDFDGTVESFALAQLMNTFGTLIGLGLSIGLGSYPIPFLAIMLAMLVIDQAVVLFYVSKSTVEKYGK